VLVARAVGHPPPEPALVIWRLSSVLRLRPASRVPLLTARSMSRSSACMSARSERVVAAASFIRRPARDPSDLDPQPTAGPTAFDVCSWEPIQIAVGSPDFQPSRRSQAPRGRRIKRPCKAALPCLCQRDSSPARTPRRAAGPPTEGSAFCCDHRWSRPEQKARRDAGVVRRPEPRRGLIRDPIADHLRARPPEHIAREDDVDPLIQ
jgi:hypothetical protein